MIEAIVEQRLCPELAMLPFLTKIGSIVQPVKVRVQKKVKTLPVAPLAPDFTQADALEPNSREAAILYFEHLGQREVADGGRLENSLRLVCWANLDKLDPPQINVVAANVLAKLNKQYESIAGACKILCFVEGFEVKSPAVFSRYSYDEAELQFLQKPYDYFALRLKVLYTLSPIAQTVTLK